MSHLVPVSPGSNSPHGNSRAGHPMPSLSPVKVKLDRATPRSKLNPSLHVLRAATPEQKRVNSTLSTLASITQAGGPVTPQARVESGAGESKQRNGSISNEGYERSKIGGGATASASSSSHGYLCLTLVLTHELVNIWTHLSSPLLSCVCSKLLCDRYIYIYVDACMYVC